MAKNTAKNNPKGNPKDDVTDNPKDDVTDNPKDDVTDNPKDDVTAAIPDTALQIFETQFGKPSFDCLRERLLHHKAQAENPFEPITVLAPSGQARTTISFLTISSHSLAGVNYRTSTELADHLLHYLKPQDSSKQLANPLQKIATLRSLDESLLSGFMAENGDDTKMLHPNTQDAIIQNLEKLENLKSENLKTLEKSHPTLLSLFEAYKKSLGNNKLLTKTQLLIEAVQLAGSSELKSRLEARISSDVGPILVYMPEPLLDVEMDFLLALSSHTPVEIIACLTNDEALDQEQMSALKSESLAAAAWTEQSAAHISNPEISITSCPSPIEEVRAVRAEIHGALEAGTAPHQMAVLYTKANPYQKLLLDLLENSGLPIYMQTGRTLLNSIAGRALNAILEIADNGYSLDSTHKLLEAKYHNDAHLLSQLKHQAGQARIPGGSQKWKQYLDSPDLASFLNSIFTELEHIKDQESWADKTKSLQNSLALLFDGNDDFAFSREASALKEIHTMLQQASLLDSWGKPQNLSIYREILIKLLSQKTLGRLNRFGRGIFIGNLSQALNLNLDHIWIVGLADGIFPDTVRFSPIISTQDWEVLTQDHPATHRYTLEGKAKSNRRFLSAVRQSANLKLGLSFPRELVSQISGISGEPSYLLEEMGFPEPNDPSYLRLEELKEYQVQPATPQEYNMARLFQGSEPSSKIFENSQALIQARDGSEFTSYEGFVPDFESDSEFVISPTQIEHYTDCPLAYFFRHVLGIQELDYSETTSSLSPLEKGSLIHKILEKFYNQAAHNSGSSKGSSQNSLQILDAITINIFEEKYGVQEKDFSYILKNNLWDIRIDLKNIHRYFSSHKNLKGISNEEEFEFTLDLSGSKNITLRGRIDRVIEDLKLKNVLALDYKTGSTKKFEQLLKQANDNNPSNHWAQFQHLIYALAVENKYPSQLYSGGYLFSSEPIDEKKNPILTCLNPDTKAELSEILDQIMKLISEGIFPHGIYTRWESNPLKKVHACGWCDPYKPMGTHNRQNLKSRAQLLEKSHQEKSLKELLYPSLCEEE